ncbi:hypothetical protein I5677_00560 [Mobilitalea sibirica]|uniref:SynChlorMet cassette protein ScmC n=1 Tax=Mobilitalea sibirica TaxID=1462919 RepID=A0A8J7KZ50_9FIRM|nr:hypothetical protein [Mobilitalea sibirica]MBH1939378.1 hypothetical protein [Mobilitalea sibirica]
MTNTLMIAGVSTNINSNQKYKIKKRLQKYILKKSNDADLKLFMEHKKIVNIPDSTLLMDENIKWYKSNADGCYYIYIFDMETTEVSYQIKVNHKWDEAVITYVENTSDITSMITGPIGEILFRNHILFQHGIVIHAAAIDWKGKGILFSAPSGTGKSTQAKLWRRIKGAKIINEDRPAVRIEKEYVYVHGTPWNGSSPKCTNCSVPLSAIVMIEQSEENSIELLKSREGISRVLPRCFLPYYDGELMQIAMYNIEKIIDIVPIYLLKCRPEREAVELVYQCVK